ncbi:AraC family transcriptional regulator [uncultured Kordia sp.]|uniref:AraC family transcriptional regulator n=1 Tax=uncultured Kordia sp. TaxID=507699 RepID=UPI0026020AED|nr:AraC family transcriptional regulator [uncultured Kordia sp.]
MRLKHFYIIAYFLLIRLPICSQEQSLKNLDSLLRREFKELRTQFYDTDSDKDASLYAAAYLKKAKQLQDSKKIIDGYYYKALLNSDSLRTIYIDSLIQLSSKRTDHYFMENALVIKAGDFFQIQSYKEALNLYVKAQEYAKKSNNHLMLFNINYNIGIIHNLIGNYEKALKTLKRSLVNSETLGFKDNWRRLKIISSIITSYRQLNMNDSVTILASKTIKEIYTNPKYKNLYHKLVLKQGMNLYAQQNYSAAKDSIQKTVHYFKNIQDDSNLAYAYFYLGKTYVATEQREKAINYLKKVDSIFLKVNYLFPETRPTYEILIDHYKKKKDSEKQLLYIERLLKLDSILHDKELYLTNRISEDYNTPRLLANKEQIITSLQKKERSYFLGIIGAIIIILLIGGFLIYNYIQKKIYKKRFEELLKAQQTKKQHTIIDVSDAKKNELNIPEDIIKTVLNSLAVFKENNEFLSSNINLQKLAKRLKTNHTYLSKIVNVYEGKSFNTFMNDLRIDYTIERLQNDAVFRKYTIDAIAEESGFSNTRTFSRSFQRKTNLNPSYFIKNLNASFEK